MAVHHGVARPPSTGVSGPVLFARYAYGPNRLGLCGPDRPADLLAEGSAAAKGDDDRLLRELARGFDGAYPYLELIARANNLPDPLDRRVVEGYWLGNDLLDAVVPGLLGASLDARFRGRLPRKEWGWLADAVSAGGRPVHAFHVLDVFPRLGLLRGSSAGGIDRILETIEACRIRWGTVEERVGDLLVVSSVPLELVGGRLQLGAPRHESVHASRDGFGFLDEALPGDVISMHWDWACERLRPDALRRLRGWTERQVRLANRAI